MSSSSTNGPTPLPPSPDAHLRRQVIKSMLYHKILQKCMIPPKELGVPLKQIYPSDWNAYYQIANCDKYGPDGNLDAWKRDNPDLEMMSYLGNFDICNKHISATSKMLLDAEEMLIGLAREQVTHNDFEAKWTAVDMEKKRRIVLDGLVRAAFKAREKSRFDCPEMSHISLVGDGEFSLVQLLKAIAAHDPAATSPLHSVYLFPHPVVEKEYAYINAPRDFRAFGQLRILQRNYFIVQGLVGIVQAYAGEPAPSISLKEESERQQCPCGLRSSPESPIMIHECIVCAVAWCCACSTARDARCDANGTSESEGDEEDESDAGSDTGTDDLPPEDDFESSTEDGEDEE
ncbi:hypothetical protein C8R45DRAFT_1218984 [Mycena sanguinolenta]|nr:hypothetical protein C8R45DRAFT_1218984 [Mycena sanguinolenta]